jgi:hypothetical protein
MMAAFQKRWVSRTAMYLQDYGGPVGFRIIEQHPEWLEWLIIQNTNAFEEGFNGSLERLRGAYWLNKTPETEEPLRVSAAGYGQDTIPAWSSRPLAGVTGSLAD